MTKTDNGFSGIPYTEDQCKEAIGNDYTRAQGQEPDAGDAFEAFEKLRSYVGKIQKELWKSENGTQKISEMLLCLCNSYRDYDKEITEAYDIVKAALSRPKPDAGVEETMKWLEAQEAACRANHPDEYTAEYRRPILATIRAALSKPETTVPDYSSFLNAYSLLKHAAKHQVAVPWGLIMPQLEQHARSLSATPQPESGE